MPSILFVPVSGFRLKEKGAFMVDSPQG